ncbi:unnamed protein product [Sphagnum tenellum]
MQDPRMGNLLAYARKAELKAYEKADSSNEYYHLLAEKICKIQKELEEKRAKRLQQPWIRLSRIRIGGIRTTFSLSLPCRPIPPPASPPPQGRGPHHRNSQAQGQYLPGRWRPVHLQRLAASQPPGRAGRGAHDEGREKLADPADNLATVAAPMNAVKEWQATVAADSRSYLIYELVQAIFPTSDPRQLLDPRMHNLVAYSKRAEVEIYALADSRPEYYRLIGREDLQGLEDPQRQLIGQTLEQIDRSPETS